MECILHIGTPKTGTTAIQAWLNRNAERLRSRGVFVPTVAGYRSHKRFEVLGLEDEANTPTLRDLGAAHPEGVRRERAGFRRDLGEALRAFGNGTLAAVSCEQLYLNLGTAERVARLRTALADYFDRVRVLVYLRRQDRMAVSMFSTNMKSGGVSGRILPGGNLAGTQFDYRTRLRGWVDAFGADCVEIRSFEHAKRTIVPDYLAQLGLTSEGFDMTLPRANSSVSAEAQEFLRLLNRHVPRHIEKKKNPDRAGIGEVLGRAYPGKGMLPAASAARRFYATFAADNQALLREWVPTERHADFSSTFDDDFSEYPRRRTEVDLTPELCAEMAALLWKERAALERRKRK